MSSRTPCRFFLAGNCRNGSRCRFYHDGFSSISPAIMADATGEEVSISPGDRVDTQAPASASTSTARPAYAAVRPCQWYMAGYCLRGDSCWFSHDRAWIDPSYRRNDTVAVDDSEDEDQGAASSSRARVNSDNETEGQKCAICFEEPSTFGLLVSCNHAFCLTCIRTWRSKDIAPDMHPQDRNGSVTKACPNCRTPSLYIVPSSYFPTSPEQKENIIRNYKEATARRPCKHFKESGDRHWCPFGDACFFAHQDENGEPCKVNPESDPRRRRQQQRHRHLHHTDFGGGRNRSLAGQYQARSSRYAPDEALALLQRGFFAGLTGVEEVSEMEIEALRVLLADLAGPLRSNYSSGAHLDVVDLDEDDFDDDDEDDEDDWEDEEDDDDYDDNDDHDHDDDLEDAFDDHYRLLLEQHFHNLHDHEDF